MNIKKYLLDKIKRKAEQREKLSEEITQRSNNVEDFVIKILDELDSNLASTANTSLFNDLGFRSLYAGSIEERIRTLDSGANVSISWASSNDKNDAPRINGILITWSQEYKNRNNCESQLYVDIVALLLK